MQAYSINKSTSKTLTGSKDRGVSCEPTLTVFGIHQTLTKSAVGTSEGSVDFLRVSTSLNP